MDEIVVVYDEFVSSEEGDPKKIKRLMARDASWGTFVEDLKAATISCGAASAESWKRLEPRVVNIKKGYHEDPLFCLLFDPRNFNFEAEGVDHFVSTIAGDILLNPNIKNIEVADFYFKNEALYAYFPGPNFVIERIYSELFYRTLGEIKRPLLAFTVKPRIGLDVKDYVTLFVEAAKAGVDLIEDDERLIDPVSCPFEDRVDALSENQKDCKTLYSPNITGPYEDAIRRLNYAYSKGIKVVKFDVLVHGFETLRRVAIYIRERLGANVAITVYPDAYGAYRKLGKKFILKMSRLCGADIMYAGSPSVARYDSAGGPVAEALEPIYTWHNYLFEPIERAPHIKNTLPTITNDQHPSVMELITVLFRRLYNGHYKYAFFVGGGIAGFPDSIYKAGNHCIECLKNAATGDLSNYNNYDFESYRDEFKKIGWPSLDVAKTLAEC